MAAFRPGGGGTDDYRFAAVMQEEVSYTGVIGSANGFTLHNDIVLPYFIGLCNDEQKARWLPGMVTGECITAIPNADGAPRVVQRYGVAVPVV